MTNSLKYASAFPLKNFRCYRNNSALKRKIYRIIVTGRIIFDSAGRFHVHSTRCSTDGVTFFAIIAVKRNLFNPAAFSSSMTAHTLSQDVKQYRKPGYDIDPLFVNRWSPRAMNGEPLSDDELMPLFEAARWAPSSFNNQHWRFIYAKRDTPAWKTLFDFLGEFNQAWCTKAAVLVVIISKTTFDYNGKPAITYSFDTGAAWENLALEGSRRGLVVHGMEGFDYAKAKHDLGIPDDYRVEAMAVIGKHAPKESLPPELQAREQPSDRKPLKDIVWEGKFMG